MTCKDCVHYFVCHRIINGIPITWADKCGDFIEYEKKDAYDRVLAYLKASVDDFPDYHEAIEAVLEMKGGD